MNNRSINAVSFCLKKIEGGSFGIPEVEILLLHLRPYSHGSLRDICNFIAHPEGRTSGNLYEYIESIVRRIVESPTPNKYKSSIYTKDVIINELWLLLKDLNFDGASVKNQSDKFMLIIMLIMAGSAIQFEIDNKIIRAQFESNLSNEHSGAVLRCIIFIDSNEYILTTLSSSMKFTWDIWEEVGYK